MALSDGLNTEVANILAQRWELRDGQVVPETEGVVLSGGGVKLNTVILYADLSDSTSIAMYDASLAARLYKAFLAVSTRIIRAEGGHIRSFDGDRVMGIFVGDPKNASAARAGLKINWAFLNLIKPKCEAAFIAFRNGTLSLAHCTGIDRSDVLAVRAGIRNNNDLVWVGRAPNVAAKMSAFRDAGYHTFITGEVYDMLSPDTKFSGTPARDMWEQRQWNSGPVNRVYRSNYWWTL